MSFARAWPLVLLVIVISGLILISRDAGDHVELGSETRGSSPAEVPTPAGRERPAGGHDARAGAPWRTDSGTVEEHVVVTLAGGEPVPGVSMRLVADTVVAHDGGGVGGAQRLAARLKVAEKVWFGVTDAGGRALVSGVPRGLTVRWICLERAVVSVMPARDDVAESWREEVPGMSGVFLAGAERAERTWTVRADCGLVGEVASCRRAVVRLFGARPSGGNPPPFEQERYGVVGPDDSRFSFRGLTPGPKLVTVRFEEDGGVVGFVGVRCEALPGLVRDVGLLSPAPGGEVELRLELTGVHGERLTTRGLGGGEDARFSAFLTSLDPVPVVRDITERFLFADGDRVRLVGLPRSRLSVFGVKLEPPAGLHFHVQAPARTEFTVPGDAVVEIPVRVAPLVDFELVLPLDVDRVEHLSSVCVSSDGWRTGRLRVRAVEEGAVTLSGRLAVGRWRAVGSLGSDAAAWTFDCDLDLMEQGSAPVRMSAEASAAAWIEGAASPDRSAVVWFSTAELARSDAWPFGAAVGGGGRYRAAVPCRSVLLSRETRTTVSSGDAGETVVVE